MEEDHFRPPGTPKPRTDSLEIWHVELRLQSDLMQNTV